MKNIILWFFLGAGSEILCSSAFAIPKFELPWRRGAVDRPVSADQMRARASQEVKPRVEEAIRLKVEPPVSDTVTDYDRLKDLLAPDDSPTLGSQGHVAYGGFSRKTSGESIYIGLEIEWGANQEPRAILLLGQKAIILQMTRGEDGQFTLSTAGEKLFKLAIEQDLSMSKATLTDGKQRSIHLWEVPLRESE